MNKYLASAFFSAAIAPAVFAAERVQNRWVRAEADDATGNVAISLRDASEPFAQFRLPQGKFGKANGLITVETQNQRLSIGVNRSQPFIELTLAPLAPCASLALPDITLAATYAPSAMSALGTTGLTPADGHPGSYMFLAVAQPETRKGIVAAWLTSLRGSGIVFSGLSEDKSRIVLRAESQYGRCTVPNEGETFVIGAFDDCLNGLERYADAVAGRFGIHLPPQIAGYCTWYADKHSGAGDESSTRTFADFAAEKLVPYGFSFFQIDDKWQCGSSKNGPDKNFTAANPEGPYRSGMKATADYLKSKGIRAGIWFMPFSGNSDDPWYADKQEWFAKSAIDYPPPGEKSTRVYPNVREQKGAPYESFWGGTSLDMTDTNVAAYMTEEVKRINSEWGYTYFKYDGMWTAMACEQLYVNDGYRPDDIGQQIFDDPHVTNVEAFRKGLQRVRDAAPGVFILGCNVSQNMRTMGAAYGLVDAMRIGPDNGNNWEGLCRGPIRGTARYFYNGRVWYNDPDPVYVRDSVPIEHARLITSWTAVAGALYAFSDWLPSLSAERVRILQQTMAPCPRIDSRRPVDLFESKLAKVWSVTSGDRHIIGLFNWDGKAPCEIQHDAAFIGLKPDALYAGFDFWRDAFIQPFGTKLTATLAPGSCEILSLRELRDRPVLVSTSRHVMSPAFEVSDEDWSGWRKSLGGRSRVVKGDRYELRVVLPKGMEAMGADIPDAADVRLSPEGKQFLRVSCVPRTADLRWRISFK